MKLNADLAFKRLGILLHLALKSISLHRGVAFISTGIPFGAKSSSHNWGAAAEVVTDLANKALNGEVLSAITSVPTRYIGFYKASEMLDADIAMETFQGLLYKPPMQKNQVVEIYVDDNFAACLDRAQDGVHETELVFNKFINCFYTVFVPEVATEGGNIKRGAAVSLPKLKVQGVPREF